jgi:hypothetical protein
LPGLESTYARLAPRGAAEPVAAAGPAAIPASGQPFASAFRPGGGQEVLAAPPADVWAQVLRRYKQRKAGARGMAALPAIGPAAPVVPGGRNWAPLGPTVVLDGATVGGNAISGRTPGLAIAPGGMRVYAATACGGVFRSDDAGTSWRSLMDGFDLNPTDYASASLACGAIAVDHTDPDRVYVGTGEGETHALFLRRVVGALPSYRGVGPIRTDDGGVNWITEPTAAGSPGLAGEAFFALAIDPGNRDHVVAATTKGLYQRTLTPFGGVEWVQRRAGTHCSVVVARVGGVTRFFAAEWGGEVLTSTDGTTWAPAGSGFPPAGNANPGRITLGAQPSNLDVLYAFVADVNGMLRGLHRLDGVGTAWREVANPPDVLPDPKKTGRSQGDYDLALAVDPADVNLVYLGGSFALPPTPTTPDWRWPGSVWRCSVQATATGYEVAEAASIGTRAHADVHVLIHSPGNANELWCGCDGGVFLNRAPRDSGEFASQNTGLSSLCSNFIAHHPTDPGVLFTGLQDNGSARTSGSPMWRNVTGGDGGYCVVNWSDPQKVLVFLNGWVFRSTNGGETRTAWSSWVEFPWATMTLPIVTPPPNAANPAAADTVALGAGLRVNVSDDFGLTWPTGPKFQFILPPVAGPVGDAIFALNFATDTRLFVATTGGRVFRAERTATGWAVARLDDAAAGPLGLVGLITDVAIDWADSSRQSVYVSFAGRPGADPRRVWWYDGANARWEARSGPPGRDCLLDVEHNALAVDPLDANNVYAGADIGVWHSPDRGQNWRPLENGLPDSPVFDLQIHPAQRLLRAATHGRGVYEIELFPPPGA